MENGKQAAFGAASEVWHQLGLTKREYFAGLAMQGLLSHHGKFGSLYEVYTKYAVIYADALLAELDKTENQPQ